MTPKARPPVATMLLVFANIAAAYAVLLDPDLINTLGFRPDSPEFKSAFTCLFVHANVLHLFGNMLFLAAVGSAVEMSTGIARYLCVYFISGLAGVALHFAFNHQLTQPTPVIGASGCVAGCVGYFALRYRTVRIDFLPKLSMPVYGVTLVWLLFQGVGAVVNLGSNGGTAFWSHLGGFGFGVLLSLVFRTPDFRMQVESRERILAAKEKSPVATKSAALTHLVHHPKDVEVLEELAEACRDTGDDAGEIQARLTLIALQTDAARDNSLDRLFALDAIGRLSRLDRHKLADESAERSPKTARFLLESLVADAPDSVLPDALLDLAQFERERKPEEFNRIISRVMEEFSMSDAANLIRRRGWVD